MFAVWLSYWSLGAIGVRQWRCQYLTVPTAGPHPGEGVGASDVWMTAPRGAQDTPGLWNVRVPCGWTSRRERDTGNVGVNTDCGGTKPSDKHWTVWCLKKKIQCLIESSQCKLRARRPSVEASYWDVPSVKTNQPVTLSEQRGTSESICNQTTAAGIKPQ